MQTIFVSSVNTTGDHRNESSGNNPAYKPGLAGKY
jgi:hypothetical protein